VFLTTVLLTTYQCKCLEGTPPTRPHSTQRWQRCSEGLQCAGHRSKYAVASSREILIKLCSVYLHGNYRAIVWQMSWLCTPVFASSYTPCSNTDICTHFVTLAFSGIGTSEYFVAIYLGPLVASFTFLLPVSHSSFLPPTSQLIYLVGS